MSEKLTKGLRELVKKEAGKAARKEEKMEPKSEKECEKRVGRADGGADKWIQKAIKHPGSLHAELGVPLDKKIPEKKLEKALHSRNPTMRKQANLANTLKNFKRKM